MKLLSIDPGVARTGFAVFRYEHKPLLITWGCITTSPKKTRLERFARIHSDISKIIGKHAIDLLIIEELFFNTNKTTLVPVAQAQGALMIAAAEHKIGVEFLTPLFIKQTLTGYGRADKKQVQKMVMILLKLDKMPQPDDAADAIACGLAYCSIQKFAHIM